MKKKLAVILSMALMVTAFCSCDNKNDNEPSVSVAQTEATTTEETTPPPPQDTVVNVLAVGDNLIHSSIYNQAAKRANYDGYDFDFAYQGVEDMLKGFELSILNQETPIANDTVPPSDYPLFNSPTQLGDKMIDLGFNAISHCNNHILDKGEAGLLATLDYWESRDTLVYGAYRDEESLNTIPLMEINGITFSFVGFMEHTNMLYLPENSPARLVYTKETEKMKELIEKANGISDVVVVSVHWGIEITNQITDEQKQLARDFTDWGADLIIGTQPHAVQSMEYIQRQDGTSSFVAYSLGNFISAQNSVNPLIGIVLDLDIIKDGKTGQISIQEVKAKPVITHYYPSYKDITLYQYKDYNDELALSHGVNSKEKFSMEIIDYVLKNNIPEEFLCLD